MKKGVVFCVLAGLLAAGVWADSDGSRSRAVHVFGLRDADNAKIVPNASAAPPLSTRTTCGACHDYGAIEKGWHFSQDGDPGRPGEPWVLVDEDTGTQLPISARGWPGTWKPEELGLTPWDMTKLFGRHAPGGQDGGDDPEHALRWGISGEVEINCLACHNAAPDQNMSEWAIQLARENFQWAATAASGLAVVDGVASRLPDWYDAVDGPNPDNAWARPPDASYNSARFDSKNRVFFDVSRRPPDDRCYFCHSTQFSGGDGSMPTEDVHHAAGLRCTDCHRNGIDHQITRGYEAEDSSFSCRACHIQDGNNPMAGRLGAPVAEHRGLPEHHFENLACTACHSGPAPAQEAGRVRTARANRLGIHGKAQWDTDLPYIVGPVFARDSGGPVAPHNMLWPAFWGVTSGGAVTPLPLEQVRTVVARVLDAKRAALASTVEASPVETETAPETAEAAEQPLDDAVDGESLDAESDESPADAAAETTPGETPAAAPPAVALESADFVTVLQGLADLGGLDGTPVYVNGGTVYQRDSAGALQTSEYGAEPYAWPIGHDVRPAAQALGAGGCGDCHSGDAAFFHGGVSAAGPFTTAAFSEPMYQLQGWDPALLKAWTRAERMHRVYMIAGGLVAGLLGLVLVRYGVRGLERAARALVAQAPGAKKSR